MNIGTPGFSSPAARVAAALGGARRCGDGWLCRCCVHEDRNPSLSLRDGPDGKLLMFCFAGCSYRDIVGELRLRGLVGAPRQSSDRGRQRSGNDVGRRRDLAQWLWRGRLPLAGTLAERYLLQTRGCRGPFPCTLGFLPANRNHPPALIAAYGVPDESEPELLELPIDSMSGVQLIKLTPDACKLDKPITIGRCLGAPIVVAPMNDLLGLAVAEGVEDAVWIAEATGLGAWAAGGASRLKALAATVPVFANCISILQDDDPAGKVGAADLSAELLKRGCWRREQIECVRLAAPGGSL